MFFCFNVVWILEYEKEMEEDVAEDLSGDLRSLIIGIINGGRDESEEVDSEKVQEDAKVNEWREWSCILYVLWNLLRKLVVGQKLGNENYIMWNE